MSANPTQTEIDEGYKQAKIATRCRALTDAKELLSLIAGQRNTAATAAGGQGELVTVEQLIETAEKIESYIMRGIEAPKVTPPSTIERVGSIHHN